MTPMKVGMIQSNYIPWRGYFDFIDDVDLFIFYDDVPYGMGKKWRNRNLIKTRYGPRWLTVPLKHGKDNKLISEVAIDYSKNWQAEHINRLYENYHNAPFWNLYIDDFSTLINKDYTSISDLNVTLCKWIMGLLNIKTEVRMSHEFDGKGDKARRPLDLLIKVRAGAYLTGPNTEAYTDVRLFHSHRIRLEFKSYQYRSYRQSWGPFINEVSILDLLFNTGPEAGTHLKSLVPNRVAVDDRRGR